MRDIMYFCSNKKQLSGMINADVMCNNMITV